MESVISMLNESKLPGTFWWDAVAAFTHVHNRSPTASMPADIMTKSLPKATVELMRKMHGLEK